jgi:hypothetical protein
VRAISTRAREGRGVLALSNKVVVEGRGRRKLGVRRGGEGLRDGPRGGEVALLRGQAWGGGASLNEALEERLAPTYAAPTHAALLEIIPAFPITY